MPKTKTTIRLRAAVGLTFGDSTRIEAGDLVPAKLVDQIEPWLIDTGRVRSEVKSGTKWVTDDGDDD